MVFTSVVNWAIERFGLPAAARLVPARPADLGDRMSIFLSNFVQVTQGPRNKSIPPFVREVIVIMERDGYEVAVSYKQIIIWSITALLLIAFWYLVSKTSLGRAQRACEQDQKMAALVGVDGRPHDCDHIHHRRGARGGAGTMYLMHYGVVSFYDGFVPGIKAFTAAVLGGIARCRVR